MGTEEKERAADPALADEVVGRLYEVAVDPLRLEALLDRWEALMAPRRGEAVAGIAGHVERAERVLDRALAEDGPSRLRPHGRTAAFALDAGGAILEANEAAAALGARAGGHVRDLPFGAEDRDALLAALRRLFAAADEAPCLLRLRAGERLVLAHLRLVTGAGTSPFVVAATTELAWPPGFGEVLRAAFEFTPAEAEVVRALAEGASIAEVAEARGRSVETVRAQLKAIMAKSETRSQAELVRLVLATLEMAHQSHAAAEALPPLSRGTGTLLPRPFRTLDLPDARRLDFLVLGAVAGERAALHSHLDYGLVRWPASAEAEAARRGLKVVVPVRGGFGRSSPLPRGVNLAATVADDWASLLDHLGIETASVLTLGSDVQFALAFARRHPGRMTRLVACAPVMPLTRAAQYERMEKWHRFILAGARYTPHLVPFLVKAGFALAKRLGKRGFVHAVYGHSAADMAAFADPEVDEAMTCGSEVALSDAHSAHDAFAREVIAYETGDASADVAALREAVLAGHVEVHALSGLQDPQAPPGTLEEFRADHPWMNWRVYPDAGQLLFFAKWREALELLDPHPSG